MRSQKNILVLHNDVTPESRADDLETIIVAKMITHALQDMGHKAHLAPAPVSFEEFQALAAETKPDLVFNMVETYLGSSQLVHVPVSYAETLGIKCTGASALSLHMTTDKVLTKRIMRMGGIPTPDWHEENAIARLPKGRKAIVKSRFEHASVGIDGAACVVDCPRSARERLSEMKSSYGGQWFAESFIDGREFNVAILERGGKPQVLGVTEIVFQDWDERPRIVDYKAKWVFGSFEEQNTVRRMEFGPEDRELIARLKTIALELWRVFSMSGWARIDVRVSPEGEPNVVDVNTNPDISPDAGFMAAAEANGLSFKDVIAILIGDAE
jgi:D-alanine-D-alanine ligase